MAQCCAHHVANAVDHVDQQTCYGIEHPRQRRRQAHAVESASKRTAHDVALLPVVNAAQHDRQRALKLERDLVAIGTIGKPAGHRAGKVDPRQFLAHDLVRHEAVFRKISYALTDAFLVARDDRRVYFVDQWNQGSLAML